MAVGPVVADMSVSLDGFVADPADGVEAVFGWYAKPQPESADTGAAVGDKVLETAVGMRHELGVIIYGRRTFELADGWGDKHPTGAPVIVVSHSVPEGWPRPDGTVRFAAGIDEALEMARAIAGDKTIAIATPSIIRQLLERGLLDGVRLSVVPVLLGRGFRYFDELDAAPIELDGPIIRVGNGVTHLSYAVRR
jgi:dihydrofolate reductase